MKNLFKLVSAILVCQLAGILGTFFVSDQVNTWYKTLQVPSWNPPDWIFAPVWLTLYTLMALALFIVWSDEKTPVLNKRFAITMFFFQLVLNSAWSIIFFGVHDLFLSLAELCLLIIVLLITMFCFYRINKLAFVLLVPYLLWVCFAGFLNYNIWILN